MKKLGMICISVCCLLFLILLTGCGPVKQVPPSPDLLANACCAVQDASSVTQTLTVETSGTVTATETRTYDAAAGEVRIVKHTLNEPGAEKLFAESSETRPYRGEFDALPFTGSGFIHEGLVYRSQFTSAAYQVMFPESAVMSGTTVEIALTVESGHVTEGNVSYTSSGGEHVTIHTVYSYAQV